MFHKWHFAKKKRCNTSTHPSRVYINQIWKNFFPKTSLEGLATWSKKATQGSLFVAKTYFLIIVQPLWIPSGVPRRGCSIFFVLTLCLSLPQTPINWSPRGLYLSEFTQIIWVSQFRYLSPLGDNFELFGQIFKYFIEETTKNQPGTNLGQLKNRFLRQIETPGWPIFDQVGRPSRLVLGKKFFWIWFIYALEGIVLALQFFFWQSVTFETP